MKRSRSAATLIVDDIESTTTAVVTVDWPSLFHMESILEILQRYLSTRDLILGLSCLNKRMNTTWINCERRLSVLDMRERVHQMTGRLYKARNPILFMKKAIAESRRLPKAGARRFRCWECSASKNVTRLVCDRVRFPCATCFSCACAKMERHNVYVSDGWIGRNYVESELTLEHRFAPREVSNWCSRNKDTMQRLVEEHRFFLTLHFYHTVAYVPRVAFAPLIEKARRELTLTKNLVKW